MPTPWRETYLCGAALLAGVLAACAAASPEVAPTSQPVPAERRERDEGEPWQQSLPEAAAGAVRTAAPVLPADASCAEMLAALRGGPAAAPAMGAIGLALAGGGDPAAVIELDLPIPAAAARADRPDCLLLIEPPRPVAEVQRREVERTTVHAEYRAGVRSEPNPDYRKLRRELEAAEKGEGRADHVSRVGDPELDLIGSAANLVIQGIRRLVNSGEVEALEAELDATPRTVEVPRYEPYAYELARIATGRAATVRLALLDRRQGTALGAVSRVSERRTFEITTGRRAKDRAVEQGDELASPTLADVRRWEQEPPRPRLSILIDHLLATGTPRPGDAATILAGWERAPAPDLRPAHAAPVALEPEPAAGRVAAPGADATAGRGPEIVRIEGELGQGLGFYIGAEQVLTAAAPLGRSSLVRVKGANGRQAYGLVERSDPVRGLALVHVPTPGVPIRLYDGPTPSSGTILLAARPGGPGLPWRLAQVSAEPTLLDDDVVELLYLDLEGEPERGPPGAPLLLGDRVVGVRLGAGADARVLHYREVAAFLAAAGGR